MVAGVPSQSWKSTPQVRDLVYNEWEKGKGESQGKPHSVGSKGGSWDKSGDEGYSKQPMNSVLEERRLSGP